MVADSVCASISKEPRVTRHARTDWHASNGNHEVFLPLDDEGAHVFGGVGGKLGLLGLVDRLDADEQLFPLREKAIRLAQKMQVGPCSNIIPVRIQL